MAKTLALSGQKRRRLICYYTTNPGLYHTGRQTKHYLEKARPQGVHIYVDRGDGKGYGAAPYTDTKPDFLDDFALPASGQTAIWKYKAIYIDDDIEVGSMSNELMVHVAAML